MMETNADQFFKIQKKIVNESEIIHHEGIRHKGLSGTLCENILIRELRKAVPKLKFNRGQIYYGDISKGEPLPKKPPISSQFDIIIYEKKPYTEHFETVLVPIKQVLGVIEAKKWSYPKALGLSRNINKHIKKFYSSVKALRLKKIPYFFVTYRFKDRKGMSVSWHTEKRNLKTDYKYCFASTYSKIGIYPRQEKDQERLYGDYKDEYKRLVVDIKKLIR